jgi:hypothetical protein
VMVEKDKDKDTVLSLAESNASESLLDRTAVSVPRLTTHYCPF